MVLAAAVLTGVFAGTGMVEAIAEWLTRSSRTSMGPHLAVITGVLSHPVHVPDDQRRLLLRHPAGAVRDRGHYGIAPVEMARASITGQTVHMQSPLVPAILLLVSLAGVSLADHHKKVLWRAVVVSLTMLVVGVLVGSIPF